MKFHAFLAAVAAFALLPAGAAATAFRAPQIAPQVVALPAPAKALAEAEPRNDGRGLHVGDVRALQKSVSLARWEPADGGFVARLRAASPSAQGLRVRLDLGTLPGPVEVRAKGSGSGPIETMVVDPALGIESWTPWTEGDEQLVEIYSRVQPASAAVSVGGVLHFFASPYAKAAASCTLSTACTSGDPALDAAITERKRSLMLLNFVSGGRGIICSATLIDTPQRPVANVLTANHCVTTPAEASTITSIWFYEQGSCGGTNIPGTQVAGGMQLVFTNFNVDSTLLRMNQSPPQGAAYSPLDPTLVADNTAGLVSISHPTGDSSRWAQGTMEAQYRPSAIDVPYNMYFVRFSRGMVQGGSSGSGVFTRGANGLALTGILSLGPVNDSCEVSAPKYGAYGRLEVFYNQIAQYIGVTSPAPDDAPNRPADVTADVAAGPLDLQAQPVSVTRRIDYAGDVDVYRFRLSAPTVVTLYTEGNLDLVSTILDGDGVEIVANDDAQTINNNTGITRQLQAGTYYVHIADWLPNGTGNYSLVLRSDRVDSNYTALWWDAAESGWGLNVNHQGNVMFATLFTYDDDGAPMWLVMSGGEKQADGSYLGTLRRTTGPPFNSNPWGSYAQTDVGTMRITFFGPNAASLAYTVNGRQVSKSITRLNFKTPPQCSWSYFDRTFADNVQDLWLNPAEAGWGINLTQQENTVFATLFTYGSDRRDLWLLMSNGTMDSSGTVTGDLFRTRGPRFDSPAWSATPIQYTNVGTMSISFEDGNHGTLTYFVDGVRVTKPITRFVFGNLKTQCEQ